MSSAGEPDSQPPVRRTRSLLVTSLLLTNLAVFALSRSLAKTYGLDELIGALFLLAALWSVRRDDDDTVRYGISLGGLFPGRAGDDRALVRAVFQGISPAFREMLVALGVAAVVIPVYALGWPLFNNAPPHRGFVLNSTRWQEIATQLFAVALTEEMYFRGFVQTAMADALGRKDDPALSWRERLRSMALPIVLTSALFALTHMMVEVTVQRAVVFFPALLFGVLRVFRGGIGAAVFFHAISNLLEMWLEGKTLS